MNRLTGLIALCAAPGGSGTAYSNYDITSGILSTMTSCGGDAQYLQTRWPQPDIFTFFMFSLVGNPYIFRLSDKKWMAINDGLACGSAELGRTLDFAIVPTSPSSVRDQNSGRRIAAMMGAAGAGAEMYSLDGRQILRSARTVDSGVRIQHRKGAGAQLQVSFE